MFGRQILAAGVKGGVEHAVGFYCGLGGLGRHDVAFIPGPVARVTLAKLAGRVQRSIVLGRTVEIAANHQAFERLALAIFEAGSQLGRGDRLAILSANRSESWCASTAALSSAMSITWLHPLGSLDDQVEQIVDGECTALLVDDANFLARGADLATGAKGALRAVFSLARTEYSIDLMSAAAAAGAVNARDIARPDDVALLNYTGGTTGKSKGALRNHAQNASYTTAILSDFEIPTAPRYLVIAPMSHVAGTKILPSLMLGGTIYLMKGFDPAMSPARRSCRA